LACNNLSSTRVAELEAQLTKLESSLEKAYTAYDSALETGGVKSFKFDSGEASQWAQYHSLSDISDQIDRIEARIDYINRKLNGRANVILALRRKYNTYYGRSL
jgi:tetrahydromethanopterin S-methyltransferase subunit B